MHQVVDEGEVVGFELGERQAKRVPLLKPEQGCRLRVIFPRGPARPPCSSATFVYRKPTAARRWRRSATAIASLAATTFAKVRVRNGSGSTNGRDAGGSRRPADAKSGLPDSAARGRPISAARASTRSARAWAEVEVPEVVRPLCLKPHGRGCRIIRA